MREASVRSVTAVDESLPRPLAKLLPGHEVRTVVEAGWSSIENGELPRPAAGESDALMADQNLEFQQNGRRLLVAVVVLVADSNHLESLAGVGAGLYLMRPQPFNPESRRE